MRLSNDSSAGGYTAQDSESVDRVHHFRVGWRLVPRSLTERQSVGEPYTDWRDVESGPPAPISRTPEPAVNAVALVLRCPMSREITPARAAQRQR